MNSQPIKGLAKFISDVRSCPSRDAEEARVEREVAKIRQQLSAGGGGGKRAGYQRKKCVWKLVYISMLGYQVQFGHIECITLINSSKYSEKSAGYLSSALLLADNDDILGLAVNAIKTDINSPNEAVAALSLNFLANVGTLQMSELLFSEVQRLIDAPSATLGGRSSKCYLRSKCYVVLLRFVRLNPGVLQPHLWAPKLSEVRY